MVPNQFSPHGQMVPKNSVPVDKWSPTNLVPMDKWSLEYSFRPGGQACGSRNTGTKFLGTICPDGPNIWGSFVQGDRICWGPEVRGSNGYGTKCVAAGCCCWPESRMETKWSRPYHRKVDRPSRLCGSLFQLFRVFCKTKLMMKSHSRLKKTRSGTQKKTRNNYHVIR